VNARSDPKEVRVSAEANKLLTSLATAMVQPPNEKPSYTGSFRVGAIPDRLRSEDGESLHLGGRDYWLYRKVLNQLASEKTLEHLTDRDIDPELWDLVCELFLNRQIYREQAARRKRISQFLQTVERPWRDFEALFAVSDLTVDGEFVVGGVTLRTITTDYARSWGLDGHEHLERTGRELDGSTVAIAQVRAGSHARASERAKERIDDALNLLRFTFCGAIYARIWDEQLLFRRKGVWAVKALGEDSWPQTNYERGFIPFGSEIPTSLAGHLTEHLGPVESFLSGNTPEALGQRVARAVHWIGTSTTRETYDDKVMDLCTALETLLTTKDEGRKAEAIAVRSMLLPAALEQSFPDPGIVFFLYDEKRSDIVHGSRHRICGEQDYIRLRSSAISTVTQYVQLLGTIPGVTKHSQVVEAIDSPKLLKDVIDLLKDSRGAAAKKLRAFANARLAAKSNT